MVIKTSSATEIRALVEALVQRDDVKREAAIARLAVIGPRAIERLAGAFETAGDSTSRVAILRALETAAGDDRAARIARRGLAEGGDVAIAAVGVLRALLDSPRGAVSAAALDLLVSTALDARVDAPLRRAALRALDGMPVDVREKIASAVHADVDRAVTASTPPKRGKSAAPTNTTPQAGGGLWKRALEGHLPDDPVLLRHAVASHAASAPLGALRKLIDAVRREETEARAASLLEEWRIVRGAIHQVLAVRGSRVALYDLRESFGEGGARLPVSFIAAVQAVGDRSCLEPLAASLSRTPEEDAWWQQHLTSAFRTIARRERVSRRHALMRRITARWPQTPARVFPKAGPPSSS